MSVEFDKIPEIVWQLFDEILWADPANRSQRDRVRCAHRSAALLIACGWHPPLMELEDETLTRHGLSAFCWHKEQLKKTHQRRGQHTKAVGSATGVEALLGAESKKILEIARSDKSSDDKMEQIFKIDRSCLAWNSPKWHILLNVSEGQIRKNHFWTHTRPEEIEKRDE